MSLKRINRDKGRTPSPSPITIYSNEINKKKPSIFTKTEHPFSSRRLSSKQQHSKSLKQKNKYRIITQPIEHFGKIQHLVNSNIFGNASFTRLHDKDKQKQKEKQRQKEKQKQKQKQRNMDRKKQLSEHKIKCKIVQQCPNCVKQKEKSSNLSKQLQYYRVQIQRITQGIISWKQCKISANQLKSSYNTNFNSNSIQITQQISNIKQLIQTLVDDVQCLSKIDLVKMLKSELFVYQEQQQQGNQVQIKIRQAKQLLNELRNQNAHPSFDIHLTKGRNQEIMLRNMRCRLNSLMRQNMQLKIKLQLMSQEMDVSSVNTENLKYVIQSAIHR